MEGDETKADEGDATPDENQTENEKPKSPEGASVAKSPASTGGKQVPSSASARAPAAARRRSAESKAVAAVVMSEDKQKGKKKENGDHGGVDDDAASVGGDDEPPTKKAKVSTCLSCHHLETTLFFESMRTTLLAIFCRLICLWFWFCCRYDSFVSSYQGGGGVFRKKLYA